MSGHRFCVTTDILQKYLPLEKYSYASYTEKRILYVLKVENDFGVSPLFLKIQHHMIFFSAEFLEKRNIIITQ